MKILLTRDSVANGDDNNAPHHFELTVADNTSLRSIIESIIKISYLARIAGGEATWIVNSQVPVAIVAQQWTEPKMLTPPDSLTNLQFSGNVLSMHFDYRRQQNPNLVFEELQREHARRPHR